MKTDYFATTLFELVQTSFGIYDNPKNPEEPVVRVPFEDGVLKVENDNNRDIYFIPVDKNIIHYKPDGNIESQCDVMLICIRQMKERKIDLYFAELKERRKDWITEGVMQLQITILDFKNNHPVTVYSKKRAFLANKKKPHFHYSHSELKEKFYADTGFKLVICATIPVK